MKNREETTSISAKNPYSKKEKGFFVIYFMHMESGVS